MYSEWRMVDRGTDSAEEYGYVLGTDIGEWLVSGKERKAM